MDSDSYVTSARAHSRITMSPATARAIVAHEMKKGDVLGAARYAGVQAAKEAASYLPLSDPEIVHDVTVDFTVGESSIDVTTRVEGTTPIGARMHALSAATVAALTIYDMCKSADRTMEIGPVALFPPDDEAAV
ncbi:MAG: cyclic pyranopterin monophosphate synthase MoaC [Acidimicrobiales bacterium]